jgi:hypothetical protein
MGTVALAPLMLLALAPLAAAGAVLAWARWLGRGNGAPRAVIALAHALGAFSGVVALFGPIGAWRANADADAPGVSNKARHLAKAIAATMSSGALALFVALVGAAWLALWTWRARPTARKKLLVLGATVATPIGACAIAGRRFGGPSDRPVLEAFQMLQNIRSAQEAYRAKAGTYANVSRALAANQSTNHFALYPQAPREPGTERTAWGAACPEAACATGQDWSRLPLHVPLDRGVRFGYSTIAGRAGERPDANVIVNGAPIEWPIPTQDWYLISAVGIRWERGRSPRSSRRRGSRRRGSIARR